MFVFVLGCVYSPSTLERQKASIDVAMSMMGFLTTKSKNTGILGLVVWTIGVL